MTTRVTTVTFQGIDVIEVEVQVSLTSELPDLKNVGTVGEYKS